MPIVRAIVRDAKAKGNSFDTIILGIVKSVPFQMRAAAGTIEGSRAAN
jgi:hypothetical protein